MLTYELDPKNKYYSLYSLIRADLLGGKIKAGDRLPSKRALAENLGVSVMTVQNAYEQLLAEGYISSRSRSGYYAEQTAAEYSWERVGEYRERQTAAEIPDGEQIARYAADFVNGSCPPEMFPFSVWARLMRAVLSDCGKQLLTRCPPDGDSSLKRAISAYLYRFRGIDADPQRIVIGAGAEYLYGIIVQLLGRDKVFAVENPGYGNISAAYALNGAACVPVDVEEAGVNLSQVASCGADALHFSPAHQYPTGAVTPVWARLKLIEWADGGDRYLIEDDYDSEFRMGGRPLQSVYSLRPDKVIYVNTFSKTLAPSMRLGYMLLPPALYEKYREVFGGSACTVSLFEQRTLAAMLDGGYFERHIQRLKNYYRGVRAAVTEKLSALGVTAESEDFGGGLHLLVKFPSAPSDGAIKEIAAANGVNLKCLSDYLLAPRDGVEKRAVINYSGVTRGQVLALKIKLPPQSE